MEKLIEKIDVLLQELDKTAEVKEIRKTTKEINKDKDLKELLVKYQVSKDENLKKEILKNPLYKKFKEDETNINILILEINSKLIRVSVVYENNKW